MSEDMDILPEDNRKSLEIWVNNNKLTVVLLLLGLILTGFGAFMLKSGHFNEDPKVEILHASAANENSNKTLIIEVAGAVEKPGVYQFKDGTRIEDALIAAGGVSATADRLWMEKMLNRAARINDGQKIYIPAVNDNSDTLNNVLGTANNGLYQTTTSGSEKNASTFVNINTADSDSLESLWGIGRITAQKIIEQRPYSSTEELLTKKIIKTNVYERIKDQITVY